MKKKLSKEERKKVREEKVSYLKMIVSKARNHKTKEKEENEEMPDVPRSYKARRAGVFSFWFVFVALVLIAFVRSGGDESEATEIKKPLAPAENLAASEAGVQFAKDFAEKYFFWQQGDKGKQMREKDMKAFLPEGLDPYAGLDMDNLKSDSYLRDARLKEVEKVGKDKAKITLLVKYELTTTAEKKDDEKTPPSTKKMATKAFVVPVQYNGKTYGVYELPTFTGIQDKTNLKLEEDKQLEKPKDPFIVQNIGNFLNTFFGSYAQDGKDKLSYILEDKDHQNGLGNTMKFVEVTESNVFESGKKNEYIVDCVVIFQDPDSQSKIQTDYKLTVIKKDNQYIVTKLN